MRLVVFLALLLLAGLHCVVDAVDASATASWSNATVLASPALEVALTTGDTPHLPVDARIKIQLDALFTVAPDAALDDAALSEALDGTWSVDVDTSANSLTVQRSGNGS
ncbi:hypothetical protein PHYSODRAFT_422799, partial [Phytophthora sojae]